MAFTDESTYNVAIGCDKTGSGIDNVITHIIKYVRLFLSSSSRPLSTSVVIMAQNFATYMTRLAVAQTTAPGAAGYYHLRNDPPNPGQNCFACFAYAVGRNTRIDAQTRAQLTQAYKNMKSLSHFS